MRRLMQRSSLSPPLLSYFVVDERQRTMDEPQQSCDEFTRRERDSCTNNGDVPSFARTRGDDESTDGDRGADRVCPNNILCRG